MPHFCEFCKLEHSSMSCYHPGNAQLAALRAKVEELEQERETFTNRLNASGSEVRATCARIDILTAKLAAVEDELERERITTFPARPPQNPWQDVVAEKLEQIVALQATLAARDAEIVRLKEAFNLQHFIDVATAPLKHAIQERDARVKRLEEALEFYADPDTYFACSFLFDQPTGGFDTDFEEGCQEYSRPMPGKRARTALTESKETP